MELEKQADILQATFKHYFDMAMDHHTKAGTTSNILLIIVGAIITLIGLLQTDVRIFMGFAICVIGLFGAVWARKQYERYYYWQYIANQYQQEIANIVPGFRTGPSYYESAKMATKKCGKYHIIRHIHDKSLWVAMHLIVAAVGLFLGLYFALAKCVPT